jgi:two-component system response regulator
MNNVVILLVSDSSDDIVTARSLITRAGLDKPLVVAHDGAEALRLLQPEDERDALHPSVVLLDLKTPQMNGFDFVIHVRADPATRDVPIAVLPTVTTGTTIGELLSGEEHPDDSTFPQPRSTQELFTVLQALGVSWLGVETETTTPIRAARRETAPDPESRIRTRAAGRPVLENRAS